MAVLNDPNCDIFASFPRLDFLEKRTFKRDNFFFWSQSTTSVVLFGLFF